MWSVIVLRSIVYILCTYNIQADRACPLEVVDSMFCLFVRLYFHFVLNFGFTLVEMNWHKKQNNWVGNLEQ